MAILTKLAPELRHSLCRNCRRCHYRISHKKCFLEHPDYHDRH